MRDAQFFFFFFFTKSHATICLLSYTIYYVRRVDKRLFSIIKLCSRIKHVEKYFDVASFPFFRRHENIESI